MKKTILAISMALSVAVLQIAHGAEPVRANRCAASMYTFKDAYISERLPEVVGLVYGAKFVTRAVQKLRDDEEAQQAWKAASAEKRQAFLRELHEETRTRRYFEKLVRKQLEEGMPGYTTTPVAECVPAALLSKYPDIVAHLQQEKAMMPLALALAIDGIPALLDDDTPSKVATRQKRVNDIRGALPTYPFGSERLQALQVAAVAGVDATRVVATGAELQAMSAAWSKLNLQSPQTFHASQEDYDLTLAMEQAYSAVVGKAVSSKDETSMVLSIGNTLRSLIVDLRRK
jgi:hypothetical protein